MLWSDRFRRELTDPTQGLDSMWDRMARLLTKRGTEWAAPTAEDPALNLWVGADGVMVSAELPGTSPENLEVTAVADTLTIKGERPAEALAEGDIYHRQERIFGPFTRTVQLPFEVDPAKVEARYERGVLTVTAKRPAAQQPRKIAVKAI